MQSQARDRAEVVEGLLVRVAKGVADPARDDGDARPRGTEQVRASAGV